jgi:hypothetical protein
MFVNNDTNQIPGLRRRVGTRVFVCCVVLFGGMLNSGGHAEAQESATAQTETLNAAPAGGGQLSFIPSARVRQPASLREGGVGSSNGDADALVLGRPEVQKTDANSQLALVSKHPNQSLDVVDTSSSVDFPQAAGAVAVVRDNQKLSFDTGTQPVTDAGNMADREGQLSAVAGEDEAQLTAVADVQLGVTDIKSELNVAGNHATSEEGSGSSYAVLLALLALIAMVPVVRRNDGRRV